MGFKSLELKLPTNFSTPLLEQKIKKKLGISRFSYTFEKQSLDARNKGQICWVVRLGVHSPELKSPIREKQQKLEIPFKQRDKMVLVVGSGPAGFFCADTLLYAGFRVTLLEQGVDVATRQRAVNRFETSGQFDESNNYAFGEGGAGTFSDGKLTSRTKTISLERQFVFDRYIQAGAPAEIAYLAHPHVGSDNLVRMVKNLRQDFCSRGGEYLFNSRVSGLKIKGARVVAAESQSGLIEADYVVFATGHSSYPTYGMLISAGVPFRVKPFALGCRVEHPQELINTSQWGRVELPGVKAAEYRLTSKGQGLPVYSFCMCPGGQVVPATPGVGLNVVNGKSNYARNLEFANAAIVAGVDFNRLFGKELDPLDALERLELLERRFYDFSGSYAAPACKIEDFLAGKTTANPGRSSYPFPLLTADFKELLPGEIIASLQSGLGQFARKLKGFEQGMMLGLESKTSSLVQAIRESGGRSVGFENLYIAGEGSGHAGGIVSSAADGIKIALSIIAGS